MDPTIRAYTVIAVLLGLFDFFYGYRAFRNRSDGGAYLGYSAIAAGLVTFSYMFSIHATAYRNVSISSTVYFTMIDWMLVALTHFIYIFTDYRLRRSDRILRRVIVSAAAFDSAVLFVNIFREIAVHYVRRDTPYAFYAYGMKPLYYFHLALSYSLVALTLYLLIRKAVLTPRQYRMPYLLSITSIALVVLTNAVFLFVDGFSSIRLLDHSVFGYSLALALIHWTAFEYRYNDMLKALSMTIFENIGQGLVLFDYSDKLIMHNKKAESILPNVDFRTKLTVPEFLRLVGMPPETSNRIRISLQIETPDGTTARCDYSKFRNRSHRVIGNLFVFTEAVNDTDLLTGFRRWESFRRSAADSSFHFTHPVAAAAFTIVGLGEINRTLGRETGDQRIKALSVLLRNEMPAESYFVRGYEGRLIVICHHADEAAIRDSADRVLALAGEEVLYGLGATTAGFPDGTKDPDVTRAVETAVRSLQAKLLLNPNSPSSHALTSLVRALRECDSETEVHVRRTQKMGEALGRLIGLSDAEQAELRLLCLLHDIGKIGIPLDILNKPGKLTDAEWAMLRTHPEKGYQIALSSSELKPIASMILSHHERWDGSGYPNGLKGDAIPVLSRVIALVDSYDAMVNDRSYRKAIGPEAAQAEIRRCAGTQFDPAMAEAFLAMLAENPGIAAGERTDAAAIRLFQPAALSVSENGNTVSVLYSRYVLDIDDTISEIDERFTELTGYSAADCVGKMNQFDLIPPEDRAFYAGCVNEQFAKGPIAFLEHEVLRKDGSRLRVLCLGKRYFDSALKTFRSEIVITECKKP